MTTGPTTLMNLASSFDRRLANVWGQTEGTEARELMVTGLFGPQTDIDRLPNWGRNLTTTGEDPYLSGQTVAAQINGIQGAGAMSEMKHFAVYNGQNQSTNTEISDQALHQIYLTPYEAGFVNGWRGRDHVLVPDLAGHLDHAAVLGVLAQQHRAAEPVRHRGPEPADLAAGRVALLLRAAAHADLRAAGPVGIQGDGRLRLPGHAQHLRHLPGRGPGAADDQRLLQRQQQPEHHLRRRLLRAAVGVRRHRRHLRRRVGQRRVLRAPGAVHVAGVPGPGCPATGCTLVQAVANGSVPLSVFNQALATMLYQEQRFGMLGCNQTPVAASCTNPGGIDGDTTGNALLPTGPAHGATPSADLGTKNGDAAVVEESPRKARCC